MFTINFRTCNDSVNGRYKSAVQNGILNHSAVRFRFLRLSEDSHGAHTKKDGAFLHRLLFHNLTVYSILSDFVC